MYNFQDLWIIGLSVQRCKKDTNHDTETWKPLVSSVTYLHKFPWIYICSLDYQPYELIPWFYLDYTLLSPC